MEFTTSKKTNTLSIKQGADNANKKKEAIPLQYVDVNVIPVGPVPLAQFGIQKSDNAKGKGQDEFNAAEGKGNAPKGQKKSSKPGGGPKGFIVLDRDPREVPPRAPHLKQGKNYVVIPCIQNSVGAPMRVPLTEP